jgi:deazaflavin-dependent oxidoreductase (nitroreductase family)
MMHLREALTDAGFKFLSRSHRTILRLSGGRVMGSGFGMPVVELRTVGRKSGKVRSTVLTSPVHDESRVVLVASKGGDDRHPQWYGNLTADPEVEIVIDGETRRLRARTASEDEKAALWPAIVGAYKGYGGYQDRTERDIPVVICENRPR